MAWNLRPPDCHRNGKAHVQHEETTHVEEPDEVLETGNIVCGKSMEHTNNATV